MRLILFIVCLFVYFVSLSANLSIGVTYISKQGVNVTHTLLEGQQINIELGTDNVYLTCNQGSFNQTDPAFTSFEPYRKRNTSAYLVETVTINIVGFMNTLNCYNSSNTITADITPTGATLVLAMANGGGFNYSGVADGSAVRIDYGTNGGFIGCITTGNMTAYPPSLLLGNGTEVFIHPGLNNNLTNTYALMTPRSLEIRFKSFSERDEGQYICLTVDGNNMPLNLSFTLFSKDTNPCNLTTCPDESQCVSNSSVSLCVCEGELIFRNENCECTEGFVQVANSSNCSMVTTQATTNMTTNMTTQIPTNMTTNMTTQIPTNMTTNMTTQIPTNMTTNMTTQIPTNMTTSMTTQIPTNMTTNMTTQTTTITTTATTATMTTSTTMTTLSSLLQMAIAESLNTTEDLSSEEGDQLLNQLTSSLNGTSGPDVNSYATAAQLIEQLTGKLTNISQEQVEKVVEILSAITAQSTLEDILNGATRSIDEVVNDIISAVENLAQLLAPVFYGNDNKTIIEDENIRIEVERLDLDRSSIFGENSTAEFSLRALLGSSFTCKKDKNCTDNITDCQIVGVSIEIKNVNRYINSQVQVFDPWFCSAEENETIQNSEIMQTANTNLFSFSIASVLCNISTSNLSEPVMFNFTIQDTSLVDPTCVAVNPSGNSSYLNSEGCRQTGATDEVISCSCNHLTSFAILMSPDTEYQYSEEMGIFTYVGLSISILSLIAALLIFTFIRFKVSLSIFFVHYNLMVTVLISEVVFVVGIDRSEIPELCLIISIVLHYILLVSFNWMFFEIMNLLILIFKPRVKQKLIIHLYWPLAYGLPLIIVATTTGLSYCNYGNYRGISYPTPMSTNCWLPRRDGNYWAFIGPSLFIIAVNSVLLFVLVVKLIHLKWAGKSYRASSLHKSKTHTLAEGFVSAIRATLLLVPIMGFTWLFGVFAINSKEVVSLIFQWLFLVFNCLQGFFIFLFYCVLKTEVRDAVLLLFLTKVCRREIRLADGETLFSTISITRKLSATVEKGANKKVSLESPTKKFSQSLSLVPVAEKKETDEIAFYNPLNCSTENI